MFVLLLKWLLGVEDVFLAIVGNFPVAIGLLLVVRDFCGSCFDILDDLVGELNFEFLCVCWTLILFFKVVDELKEAFFVLETPFIIVPFSLANSLVFLSTEWNYKQQANEQVRENEREK